MPEQNQSIEYLIKLVSDTKAAIETQNALKKTGQVAKDTAGSFGGLRSEADKLGQHLVAGLGAVAIAEFARRSVVEFAKVERAWNGLRIQLEGFAASSALPKIRDFLEGIALGGGGLVSETLPAYRKFLGLTKDVNAAMYLTKLASDVAESGMVELSQSVEILMTIISGRATARQLKEIGINIGESGEQSMSAAEGLKLVGERFEGIGDAIHDTLNEMDRLNARFEQIQQKTGSWLASAGTWIAQGITRPIVALGDLFGMIDIEAEAATRRAEMAAGKIKAADVAAVRDRAQAEKERRKELDEALKHYMESIDKEIETDQKRVDIEMRAEEDLIRSKLGLVEKGTEEELALQLDLLDKQHDQAVEEANRVGAKVTAIDKAWQNARLKLVQDHGVAVTQADDKLLAEFKKDLDERTELEKKHARAQADLSQEIRDFDIDQLEETSAERLRIVLASLDAEKQARIAAAGETGEKVSDIEKLYLRRRLSAERAFSAANVEISRTRMQQEIDMSARIAQLSIDLGTAVFGESKSLSIATAIIKGALAVVQALAEVPYPLNFVVAALITAVTQAQIEKIRKTEPQGVFDDPVHDRMLLVDTKRSLQDFVKLNAQALMDVVRRPPAPAPGQAPLAPAAAPAIQIHGNVYGGPAGMRHLAREIRRATRLDRRLIQ